MLSGYTIAQVRDFYDRNFGAARAHLYVVGRFDAAAVEAAVRKAFGDWKRGARRGASVAVAQERARRLSPGPARRAAVHDQHRRPRHRPVASPTGTASSS